MQFHLASPPGNVLCEPKNTQKKKCLKKYVENYSISTSKWLKGMYTPTLVWILHIMNSSSKMHFFRNCNVKNKKSPLLLAVQRPSWPVKWRLQTCYASSHPCFLHYSWQPWLCGWFPFCWFVGTWLRMMLWMRCSSPPSHDAAVSLGAPWLLVLLLLLVDLK